MLNVLGYFYYLYRNKEYTLGGELFCVYASIEQFKLRQCVHGFAEQTYVDVRYACTHARAHRMIDGQEGFLN